MPAFLRVHALAIGGHPDRRRSGAFGACGPRRPPPRFPCLPHALVTLGYPLSSFMPQPGRRGRNGGANRDVKQRLRQRSWRRGAWLPSVFSHRRIVVPHFAVHVSGFQSGSCSPSWLCGLRLPLTRA